MADMAAEAVNLILERLDAALDELRRIADALEGLAEQQV